MKAYGYCACCDGKVYGAWSDSFTLCTRCKNANSTGRPRSCRNCRPPNDKKGKGRK